MVRKRRNENRIGHARWEHRSISVGPQIRKIVKGLYRWQACIVRSSVESQPTPTCGFGKSCIRGHRITVQELLEWLSNGASPQQILADYPQLEPEDFLAVYAYAAELAAVPKRPVDEAAFRREPISETGRVVARSFSRPRKRSSKRTGWRR